MYYLVQCCIKVVINRGHTMNRDHEATKQEFAESRAYFEALGIAAKWQDCKCQGNGYCELHDHFDPEDDSYA